MRRATGPVLGFALLMLILVAVGIVVFTVPGGFSSLLGGFGPAQRTAFTIPDVAIQPGKTVTLSNDSGNINLQTDNTLNSLKVSGYKLTHSNDDVTKINLQPVTDSNGNVVLKIIKSCFNCSVDVRIIGPANLVANLASGSGDVEVTGLNSSDGQNIFKTGSGNISLQNSTLASLKTEAGSGDIGLKAVTVQNNLNMNTGSGNINIDGDLALKNDSLINAGSGDVSLKMKSQDYSALGLNVTTDSGDIHPHFNGNYSFSNEKHSLTTVGANVVLHIRTGSGDIALDNQ